MKLYNTGDGIIALYTISDLSRDLGISRQYAGIRIKERSLPAPTHKAKDEKNSRLYYTQQQYASILEIEKERVLQMRAIAKK